LGFYVEVKFLFCFKFYLFLRKAYNIGIRKV